MPVYQVVWIELVRLWYHEHEIWSFGKCGAVYILIFGDSRTKGEIFFTLGGILLLSISASQLEHHCKTSTDLIWIWNHSGKNCLCLLLSRIRCPCRHLYSSTYPPRGYALWRVPICFMSRVVSVTRLKTVMIPILLRQLLRSNL